MKPYEKTSGSVDTERLVSSLDPYKLFFVFLVGAFIGFAAETFWCFVTVGHFEWRSGLVYAPFNPVYGFGADVLYIALLRFKKKDIIPVFFIGAAAGSAVEYFCSLIQEKTIGTVSWDYSQRPFNVGSRICLKYTVAWGLLAVLWVAAVRPGLDLLMSGIPMKIVRRLTVVMFIILLIVSIISVAALVRWKERLGGNVAANLFDSLLDRSFPDDKMMFFYPNMMFR